MNFFATLSRLKYIERWSLMRSGVRENVAEHTEEVAIFAHALGTVNNLLFGGTANPDHLAVVALFHESAEVLTGDLPTPVKYGNDALKTAYKEVERIANDRLIGMLPDALRTTYRPILAREIPEYEGRLLKAADKLSALVKCIEERKGGNKEFSRAEKTLKQTLIDYQLPEVDYFMKEFLGGFELTLDELEG